VALVGCTIFFLWARVVGGPAVGKNRAAFRSESPRGQSAPREDEGSLCAGVAGERDARKRRRGRRGTAIESRISRGRVAVRLASCARFRPSRQAPPAGRGKGRCLCGGVVCRFAHNLKKRRARGTSVRLFRSRNGDHLAARARQSSRAPPRLAQRVRLPPHLQVPSVGVCVWSSHQRML